MPNQFDDLPDEVMAEIQNHEKLTGERLEDLGKALAAKRQEAIGARKESGIELVWTRAEEAYLGIDDANRHTFQSAHWAKPTSMTGPVTTGQSKATGSEANSTAFVRLSSRYTDAGAAKLTEILFPADDKAFSFGPTPNPELIAALRDSSQAVHDGIPLERDPAPAVAAPTPGAAAPSQGGMQPAASPSSPPAAPGTPPPGVPILVKDIAQEALDRATQAAKRAETRIYDWMVQSQYRAEGHKVVFDAARIGVGVLKGPFPRSEISKAFSNGALEIVERIVQRYEAKDPWNIYPDPACGENIHHGDWIFEKDQLSAKQLRKLKRDPGYIGDAIDKVLLEGPDKSYSDAQKPGEKLNKTRYTVWYFYGTLTREEMMAARAPGVDEKSKAEVYAICTLVNDTVIRAVMNPLDSGEFPYHSVPWQRRAGHWAGVGVCEQIEMPQRAINASTRALFNNAGKSSGSYVVLDRGAVIPADGSWQLTPDKIFFKNADASVDDVRKAFAFFTIPNTTPELMSIIEYCLRLAEESTNIPLVTQGQSGPTTPETFGATQLQNNNANQLLRSIGYAYDDYITEPVVRQSYEMLLLDDQVPDDEKGDWHIDAHGSVAMVERAIQDQTISQMGQFALQPAFGVNAKRWFAQFAKTKHMNPVDFQNTPEEQAKIDQTPPPPVPAVQVAQIRSQDAQLRIKADAEQGQADGERADMLAHITAEVALQVAQMRQETEKERIKRDTDRDTVYVQAQQARDQADASAKLQEIQVNRELQLLKYANDRQLNLDQVKAQLAQTAAKLETQKELAGAAHAVDLHKHHTPPAEALTPPTEPPGKAPAGESFQA